MKYPPFEQEWDDLYDLLDEYGAAQRNREFSPTRARTFAAELICATSLDEARAHMQRDPEGAAHFSVAAHFAVGFVRAETPATLEKD